jgi:hypothetical protein
MSDSRAWCKRMSRSRSRSWAARRFSSAAFSSAMRSAPFEPDVRDLAADEYRAPRRRVMPPLPPEIAGLEIRGADTGSLDVLGVPTGELITLLTSQPAEALSQALVFLGALARIRGWRRHPDPRVQRADLEDARDLLRLCRELDSDDPSHPPELDAQIGERLWNHRPDRGTLLLPDGTRVVGRKITYLRRNQDGSTEVIITEG